MQNKFLRASTIELGDKSKVESDFVAGVDNRIGQGFEASTKVAIGLRNVIRDSVKFSSGASIGHGVIIETEATLAVNAYVGSRSHVGYKVRLASCAFIPAHTKVMTQPEADELFARQLQDTRSAIFDCFKVFGR